MEQKNNTKKKNIVCYFFLGLALISTLLLFGLSIYKGTKTTMTIESLIPLLLSTVFVIFFIFTGIYAGKKGVYSTILAALCLISLNSFQIMTKLDIVEAKDNRLEDITNKSLTEAVKYAEKNNIELNTIYEYSDMVEEYYIIGQDKKAGTKIKDIKNLKIAVSEGPNPDKEVIIPNMVAWSDKAVLEFVKENKLTNVEVEFVESAKLKDTVIEQEGTGNKKRSDKIKLIFSLGEGSEISETKLIDLTKKEEFEAIFWLKQHAIKYETKKEFSEKIKRGFIMEQSEKAGAIIKPNDKVVILTVSKGPKITVPDLTKMSTTEITEWIIKNKLKVEFNDQYDDAVKDNHVIKANYKKGDTIEQKTLISITISKGQLKMPKITNLDDLKAWATKYNVLYQEEYAFDNEKEKGEIIKVSHKEGDTIKNGESIIITISQGKKTKVPKLVGMKKQDIISKLKELKLKYTFLTQDNEKIAKDVAIAQSMTAGSEVAENTTITITLSTGKKKTNNSSSSNTSNKPNNSNNTNNNTNNGNSNNNNNNYEPPKCEPKTYTVSSKIRDIFTSYDGYTAVSNALYSFFASNYPNVKINVVGVYDSGMSAGLYVSGLKPGSTITSCNTTPYTISIAR